ncbi:hypothetical protein P5V15_009558 [Pogonomyrmex californicus]
MSKKWQLLHATNFESLMYPCFTFCRIFSVFPYKFRASTFEISKPRYILSTIVTCICCIFDLFVLYNIISSKFNYEDIIRTLKIMFYFTFNGFIIIVTYILSGPRMRLLQTILEISSKLSQETYQNLSKLIHIKDILGNIFLIVQVFIYFFKIQIVQPNYLDIFIVLFAIYLALMVFQMNMLYMNCVYILKACFKRINDRLLQIQKLMVNDMKPSVSSLIFNQTERNQFLLIELKILKKQHSMISDTVQTLNVIFCLQLLATIIISFSEITFELYSYVVKWEDGIFISLDTQLIDAFFTSMLHYVIKLVLLIWICESSKNQAQEINTIIHDVLNKTNDKRIRNELQLFCLQILHRKNTFSAKGLTVDATLFAAVSNCSFTLINRIYTMYFFILFLDGA